MLAIASEVLRLVAGRQSPGVICLRDFCLQNSFLFGECLNQLFELRHGFFQLRILCLELLETIFQVVVQSLDSRQGHATFIHRGDVLVVAAVQPEACVEILRRGANMFGAGWLRLVLPFRRQCCESRRPRRFDCPQNPATPWSAPRRWRVAKRSNGSAPCHRRRSYSMDWRTITRL